ncbi:MAG TPA: DUF1848 domain-containing protein [Syntrophomonadaceae bacterium]|nr:DUF1848 domain-containing protein [Syntrophomonadaceae bacterium]
MIISASRRTDIPAFYSEWFMNRLQQGFVYVRNPMNPKRISSVPLNLDVVDCIVFWTKNAIPMLGHLDKLDAWGYPYYFQFTLTPYDERVEKYVANKAEIIRGFKLLSDRLGKQRVIWRYDPVIVNNRFPVQYHLDAFDKLSGALGDYTKRCIFSFVDLYARVKRNTKGINEISCENMNNIARGFSIIAKSNNITLETCSEEIDLHQYAIGHASCIDQKVIEDIVDYSINLKKDTNQRQHCGCIESIDIGAYDSCPHGCIYCYATSNENTVNSNRPRHDVHSPLLLGQLTDDDILTEKVVKSLQTTYVSLFP